MISCDEYTKWEQRVKNKIILGVIFVQMGWRGMVSHLYSYLEVIFWVLVATPTPNAETGLSEPAVSREVIGQGWCWWGWSDWKDRRWHGWLDRLWHLQEIRTSQEGQVVLRDFRSVSIYGMGHEDVFQASEFSSQKVNFPLEMVILSLENCHCLYCLYGLQLWFRSVITRRKSLVRVLKEKLAVVSGDIYLDFLTARLFRSLLFRYSSLFLSRMTRLTRAYWRVSLNATDSDPLVVAIRELALFESESEKLALFDMFDDIFSYKKESRMCFFLEIGAMTSSSEVMLQVILS